MGFLYTPLSRVKPVRKQLRDSGVNGNGERLLKPRQIQRPLDGGASLPVLERTVDVIPRLIVLPPVDPLQVGKCFASLPDGLGSTEVLDGMATRAQGDESDETLNKVLFIVVPPLVCLDRVP